VAGESPSGGQSESMLAGFVPGSRVAGYRVEARIGAGGMAVVFRAHDEALGRTVALKILSPALADDRLFRERFIRESRAVAAVDHPNIIPVYSAGEADGVLYLAMRFVFGGDLRGVLSKEGRLAGDRVADLLGPIALALDRLHADGLVHRDVKPANILVDVRPGSPEHPYLSDFGLVKGAMAASGLTGTGQLLGTLNYMAPEQISGKPARPETDQYALACVAFNLLSGAQPFARDESMAVLWAHMYDAPPSLVAQVPDQPPAVDAVFARAMAKAPEDRYRTCAEMIGALRAAYGNGSSPSDEPRTSIVPSSRPSVSKPPLPPVPPTPPVTSQASAGAARHPSPGPQQPVRGSGPSQDQVPVRGGVPWVPSPPQPSPMAATMTAQPGEPSNPGHDARTHAASLGGRPTEVAPLGPPRRRRGLYIAAAAAAAVIIAVGALLAVHPWSHATVVAQPTGVTLGTETANASGTAYSMAISWSGPASGPQPDKYEIFRNGTQAGTVLGNETSFTVNGLTPDTSYAFQVVAVSDGTSSLASQTRTAQTPPSLSDAVLSYTGTVTEKMLSITPAQPGWTFKLGATKTDSWTISPDCASGPCTVNIDGAYNGFTYSTTLTRSGATYTGATTLTNYFYCNGDTTATYSATLNVSLTVTNASTQGTVWTATAFTGHETINAPVYQTCYASVGQLSVISGG
jgi:serine/threonine protein kinase